MQQEGKRYIPHACCIPHVVHNARVVLHIPAAHRARADWRLFLYTTECSALPYRIILRHIIDVLRGDKSICARESDDESDADWDSAPDPMYTRLTL